MEKFVVNGGQKLIGEVAVSGAKNVAMKVILTGLLTDQTVFVRNIPLISTVFGTADLVKTLGVKVNINNNHTMEISGRRINGYTIPLDLGGLYRTATMVMGPLLVRFGKAVVPNPGGCRLGKRPVERHIEGLKKMGAKIKYEDGYYIAKTNKLHGTKYRFENNTHTGTEALILAAVLAEGVTVLENAAAEPEVDDLIKLLVQMGANVNRVKDRTIVIDGVRKLNGTDYEIMPDRNEVVTFAIGAIASGGNVIVHGANREFLTEFLENLVKTGAGWESLDNTKMRFYFKNELIGRKITTSSYPGFMTDWQAPWALLMTQADGISHIHETIYENRFGFVSQLRKMGAAIDFYNPAVKNPEKFYNFNWSDRISNQFHAIKIRGKTILHNALLEVMDLRAGATIVLAAAIASGESIILGIEHIDRGYEKIENRLSSLGMKIKRTAS